MPGTSSGAPKQGIGQHASIGHQSVSPDSPTDMLAVSFWQLRSFAKLNVLHWHLTEDEPLAGIAPTNALLLDADENRSTITSRI